MLDRFLTTFDDSENFPAADSENIPADSVFFSQGASQKGLLALLNHGTVSQKTEPWEPEALEPSLSQRIDGNRNRQVSEPSGIRHTLTSSPGDPAPAVAKRSFGYNG